MTKWDDKRPWYMVTPPKQRMIIGGKVVKRGTPKEVWNERK